jgi:hypothetical protein
MARWIADAREAEAEENQADSDDDDVNVTPTSFARLRTPRKWQVITLERLFAKTAKESLRAKRGERMAQRAQEEERMYMQVMAELDAVDDRLDDGEVEINDSEVSGE